MIEPEKQYRKRAETAPLILTELPARHTIVEAIYWPGEGYGGGETCSTIEDAQRRARESLKNGFGRDGKSVVRIIETTKRIIEVSIGAAEETNHAAE